MVGITGAGNGRTDALANGAQDFQVMFVVVLPHADAITRYYLLGRLDRVPVEFHVPSAYRICCFTTGFKHTHCQHPGINAYGETISIRCCFR